MSTMPYWLAKTPEMYAMDTWFSLDDAGSKNELVSRYNRAIARARQLAGLRSSEAIEAHMPGGPGAEGSSFGHFDQDWLNLGNASSGGNYWPQIPTFSILTWLTQGITYAAHKGMGMANLPGSVNAADLFDYEIEVMKKAEFDPDAIDASLSDVLPMVTCWVCTNGSNFEVDAVRGPTAVSLIMATPPPYQQAHSWPFVKVQLDEIWKRIHPVTLGDLFGS